MGLVRICWCMLDIKFMSYVIVIVCCLLSVCFFFCFLVFFDLESFVDLECGFMEGRVYVFFLF